MYIDEREEIAYILSSIFLREGEQNLGLHFVHRVAIPEYTDGDAPIPDRVSKQKSDQ